MSNYSKLTIPELKTICKEKKLPVSGKKQELIDRLIALENPTIEKPTKITQTTLSKKKPTILVTKIDKPVFKKLGLENERLPIVIKRNIYGNFEHIDTKLVFSPQKKVIGIQKDNGDIGQLTTNDVSNIYKYHFQISDDIKIKDDNYIGQVFTEESKQDKISKLAQIIENEEKGFVVNEDEVEQDEDNDIDE